MKHTITILNVFLWLIITLNLPGETLYLNVRTGSDTNPGTKDLPFKTFEKVSEMVNITKETGPTTIVVSPGVYNLTQTILFENDQKYTKTSRFTIVAEKLPDDSTWMPDDMPVIISTAMPKNWKKPGEIVECAGIKPELNYVTIQGLKFLGSPVPSVWYYPIFREGKNLDDLIVTQCLFAMESYAVTCNVGVLANGHGLVIDHCIFYNCRNPVVFWRAEGGISYRNAMRYCIVDGAYTSGMWLCDTAEDFDCHHNIFTRTEYVWMRDDDNKRTYRLSDCLITENKYFSGICGPNWVLSESGTEITYVEKNVVKSGTITLEKAHGIDAGAPRNYLHVIPRTPGSKLRAGLFKNN